MQSTLLGVTKGPPPRGGRPRGKILPAPTPPAMGAFFPPRQGKKPPYRPLSRRSRPPHLPTQKRMTLPPGSARWGRRRRLDVFPRWGPWGWGRKMKIPSRRELARGLTPGAKNPPKVRGAPPPCPPQKPRKRIFPARSFWPRAGLASRAPGGPPGVPGGKPPGSRGRPLLTPPARSVDEVSGPPVFSSIFLSCGAWLLPGVTFSESLFCLPTT